MGTISRVRALKSILQDKSSQDAQVDGHGRLQSERSFLEN